VHEEALARGLLAQPLERGGVAVVARHQPQVARQLLERRVAHAAAGLAGVLAQPVEVQVGLGHADDRQVEPAVGGQAVERGQQHLARQVARDAEQDERARLLHLRRAFRAAPGTCG
jgi:hypothetical protein